MQKISESPSQTNTDNQRARLATEILNLTGRSEDQHAVIDAMGHILRTTFESTAATKETALELMPPEILLSYSCIKNTLLHKTLRDVLILCGLSVERRQGLPIARALADTLYPSDSALMAESNRLLSEYRHGVTESTARSSQAAAQQSQNEPLIYRRVDSAAKRFGEIEKYSGILAESPSLLEARDAYATFCDQKQFPRGDRVKLVS